MKPQTKTAILFFMIGFAITTIAMSIWATYEQNSLVDFCIETCTQSKYEILEVCIESQNEIRDACIKSQNSLVKTALSKGYEIGLRRGLGLTNNEPIDSNWIALARNADLEELIEK